MHGVDPLDLAREGCVHSFKTLYLALACKSMVFPVVCAMLSPSLSLTVCSELCTRHVSNTNAETSWRDFFPCSSLVDSLLLSLIKTEPIKNGILHVWPKGSSKRKSQMTVVSSEVIKQSQWCPVKWSSRASGVQWSDQSQWCPVKWSNRASSVQWSDQTEQSYMGLVSW